MDTVDCPYCDFSVNIEGDDWHTQSEGQKIEKECPSCSKEFYFRFYVNIQLSSLKKEDDF
jgi:endogenous inhibitor of DNA gyrase (YacG/DUF329 family)